MPDIDNVLADGEPGHTLHHVDLATEVNNLRARVASLETQVAALTTSNAQKFTMPAGGLTESHMSTVFLATLVRSDGTVLRAVKVTQADYDALTSKVGTTLYAPVG